MKDYYKTLGISKTASKDQIKQAFRKLAKEYHPDVNKGAANAETKFKEISEAYEVLSNDSERQKYDAARTAGSSFNFGGFSEQGPFGDFFHSSGSSNSSSSDIFEQIIRNFSGFASFNSKPNPKKLFLKIPLQTALKGGVVQVSGLPNGPYDLSIPKNSSNGTIIPVQTKSASFNILLQVEDDFPFKIRGNNIETTICLNLAQAVLGSNIKLRDPRGDEFILKIPPNSKNEDVLRLKNLGLKGGDFLVKLNVEIPNNLTDKEKEYFKEFAEKMGWKH